MDESETQSAVIVIVENDAAVLNALTFCFELEGYTVRGYAEPDSVLAQCQEDCACFILDENLSGSSGLDLYEALKLRGLKAPAILITTVMTELIRRRAAVAGVVIVEKPLVGEVLASSVRDATARMLNR